MPPVPLAHDDQGTGAPALLFVHGLACDRSDWAAQLAAFAATHRIITVDLAGHGESPFEQRHRHIEEHAGDVAALARRLGLSDLVLIGHSLGCRVVAEAAALLRDRIRGVVLIDGSLRRDSGPPGLSDPERFGPMMRAAFRQMPASDCDPALVTRLAERAAAHDPRQLFPLIEDLVRYDEGRMEWRLEDLTVPVLVFQTSVNRPDGQRTPLRPGESTPFLDLLRRKVAKLTVVELGTCGHFPQLERPAETNAHLRAFLAALPQSKSRSLS